MRKFFFNPFLPIAVSIVSPGRCLLKHFSLCPSPTVMMYHGLLIYSQSHLFLLTIYLFIHPLPLCIIKKTLPIKLIVFNHKRGIFNRRSLISWFSKITITRQFYGLKFLILFCI